MLARLFIFSAFFCVTVFAAATRTSRPSSCAVGTTYMKECNTCTCGKTASEDKCSKIDCSRQNTSPRPSSADRPGTCPTRVTPPPGNTDCAKRTEKSSCTVDKDCPQAKKCCPATCNGVYNCRNAIYNYTDKPRT